jgi:hypothetical protein
LGNWRVWALGGTANDKMCFCSGFLLSFLPFFRAKRIDFQAILRKTLETLVDWGLSARQVQILAFVSVRTIKRHHHLAVAGPGGRPRQFFNNLALDKLLREHLRDDQLKEPRPPEPN